MECGYLGEPGRRRAIEQAPAAGRGEDRFFATVFLGSGVLFVGMLFVAAVPRRSHRSIVQPAGPPGADTLTLGRNVTSVLLNVYAMRMAAVFTLTTVTIARVGRPRPLLHRTTCMRVIFLGVNSDRTTHFP
jgi:hypothetical protein